jgi:hypothetical protein
MNAIEAEQICRSAESALRHGSITLNQFPGLLQRVIEDELWKRRQVPGLGVVELSSLRELVTEKPLRGWGEDPKTIEAVIREDADVLRLWRGAMKGKPPGKRYRNNVTVSVRGHSRAYTLDRLKRARPDLYDLVAQKQLSAHAAAVQAGIIKTKTPLEHLEHWWTKATLDERAQFLSRRNASGNASGNALTGPSPDPDSSGVDPFLLLGE